MTFEFSASAAKQFRRLSLSVQNEITAKIQFYLATGQPLEFAKPLTGHQGIYRFRIRDYRVIFKVEPAKIVILKVGHRQSIYRR